MSTVVEAKKKTPVMYWVHTAITLLFFFGFGQLPAIEPLTPMGMQLVGVLLGFIYGWTTVGMIWPSIVGMIATALSGAVSMKDVIMNGFGSDTTVMILFILIFAAIIAEAGLSKYLAMWMITKKVFFGKPWLFSLVFLLAAYILSALTSTVATIIICWGLLYGIFAQLGFKAKEKYPTLMIIGVVYAATLGLSSLPFKAVPLAVMGVYTKLSGITIDFMDYVCFTIPLGILSIIAYILLCKFVFRPDVGALKTLNEHTFKEEDRNLTLDKVQKIIFGFLLGMVILLLLPSLLPATWAITQLLTAIGSTGIIMCIVAVMVMIKVDGEPLLDFRQMAIKGVQWDVIVLTAAVMPFANAFIADETGVKQFLLGALSPIFAGKSEFIFILLVVLLTIIMTNLCNNGVTGVLFVMITYNFASAMGMNPTVIAVLIIFCIHLAILTPAASPMAAILHGNGEWIVGKDVYMYGTVAIFITGVLIFVVGLPLANMLF